MNPILLNRCCVCRAIGKASNYLQPPSAASFCQMSASTRAAAKIHPCPCSSPPRLLENTSVSIYRRHMGQPQIYTFCFQPLASVSEYLHHSVIIPASLSACSLPFSTILNTGRTLEGLAKTPRSSMTEHLLSQGAACSEHMSAAEGKEPA